VSCLSSASLPGSTELSSLFAVAASSALAIANSALATLISSLSNSNLALAILACTLAWSEPEPALILALIFLDILIMLSLHRGCAATCGVFGLASVTAL